MNIKRKLQLSNFVTLVLLVALALISVFFIQRMQADVRQLTEVEEPLEQAILEMEINLGETARSVQHFIRDLEARDLERITDSERDFERYAEQFERLVETEEERALGRKVVEIYRDFKSLGFEIASLAQRRHDGLRQFRKDAETIDALIDDKLQPAIDRSSAEAMTKLEAALDMEINIDEAFAAIEGYMLEPDPEFKRVAADAEADFGRFEAQYRGTRMSAGEKQSLDTIKLAFAEAFEAGNLLITLTDEMREKLRKFEQQVEEIDLILDDQIQTLIFEETQRAAMDAQDSGETAIAVVVVAGLAILVSMIAMNWQVSRGISDGVARLSDGVTEFARGNLDHRIEVQSKDELGELAGHVNEMAGMRQRAEQEVRTLNKELEQRVIQRTAELAGANAELDAFAYSVSHDLRAPLRSMDGFSQAVLEDYADKLDAEGRDHLTRIRHASQNMAQLIDDLLTLSRVTRGELERHPIDLSATAESIATQLRDEDPARKVGIDIAPGMVVQGDERLLRIVLENLLGNAWKFTATRAQATIEFGVTKTEGERTYYLRDNGVGFDMAYVDKLFQAFQRLHSTTEFEGTGIGLTTVARIVHRHGGRVWADAATDQGATIFFTL